MNQELTRLIQFAIDNSMNFDQDDIWVDEEIQFVNWKWIVKKKD